MSAYEKKSMEVRQRALTMICGSPLMSLSAGTSIRRLHRQSKVFNGNGQQYVSFVHVSHNNQHGSDAISVRVFDDKHSESYVLSSHVLRYDKLTCCTCSNADDKQYFWQYDNDRNSDIGRIVVWQSTSCFYCIDASMIIDQELRQCIVWHVRSAFCIRWIQHCNVDRGNTANLRLSRTNNKHKHGKSHLWCLQISIDQCSISFRWGYLAIQHLSHQRPHNHSLSVAVRLRRRRQQLQRQRSLSVHSFFDFLQFFTQSFCSGGGNSLFPAASTAPATSTTSFGFAVSRPATQTTFQFTTTAPTPAPNLFPAAGATTAAARKIAAVLGETNVIDRIV